eukprot:TRINITY_DN40771_c0_g1_i1.p1 TRINITY_DN40771_c0_g1~~TRINITY_DN40771_c0_g1_i1.p1  ORF type:complete len:394 (-),score=65.15 TRINITY_DN40771_c0_g1_i1:23-1204(-)
MTETVKDLTSQELLNQAVGLRRDIAQLQARMSTFRRGRQNDYEWLDDDPLDDIRLKRIRSDTMGSYGAFFKGEKQGFYLEGIKLFNTKPQKGLNFLFEKDCLDKTSKDTAQFLLNEPSLCKKKIGEFIGDISDFNKSVRKAFVDDFDFKGFSFDEALRAFLSTFCLPGEAQIIDRLVEEFARGFFSANRDAFEAEETAYILAFSTIMLNTDQHNPNVKRPMTVDEFIRNNRGIDKNGKDLPRAFLENIYNNIKAKEFDLPTDASKTENPLLTFFTAEKEGWLSVSVNTSKKKVFRTRWCVLSQKRLFFFKSQSSRDPIALAPITEFQISASLQKFTFDLLPSDSTNPSFTISANCSSDFDAWTLALNSGEPIQALVRDKKRRLSVCVPMVREE